MKVDPCPLYFKYVWNGQSMAEMTSIQVYQHKYPLSISAHPIGMSTFWGAGQAHLLYIFMS